MACVAWAVPSNKDKNVLAPYGCHPRCAHKEQGQRLRFASVASRRNLRPPYQRLRYRAGWPGPGRFALRRSRDFWPAVRAVPVNQGQEREARARWTQPAEGSPQGLTLREQSAAIPCPIWPAPPVEKVRRSRASRRSRRGDFRCGIFLRRRRRCGFRVIGWRWWR